MKGRFARYAGIGMLTIVWAVTSGCHDVHRTKTVGMDSIDTAKGEDSSMKTPAEAIDAFADATDGHWNPSFRVLSYGIGRPAPDFVGGNGDLPVGALALVKELGLGYVRPALTQVPNLSLFPNLIDLRLSGNRITNIDALAGLLLRYVSLDQNPISSISALGTCTDLTGITASGTNITHLPNLERLSKLQSLVVGETPLTTLDGIEMLPNKIDLVVTGCRELVDISALLAGTVNRLVVDDEMLVRFRRWLDVHTSEIKKANPNFEVTTFYSGE